MPIRHEDICTFAAGLSRARNVGKEPKSMVRVAIVGLELGKRRIGLLFGVTRGLVEETGRSGKRRVYSIRRTPTVARFR